MFHRNIGRLSTDYTALYPRRQDSRYTLLTVIYFCHVSCTSDKKHSLIILLLKKPGIINIRIKSFIQNISNNILHTDTSVEYTPPCHGTRSGAWTHIRRGEGGEHKHHSVVTYTGLLFSSVTTTPAKQSS
jgi:hypothetical protein